MLINEIFALYRAIIEQKHDLSNIGIKHYGVVQNILRFTNPRPFVVLFISVKPLAIVADLLVETIPRQNKVLDNDK